MAFTQASHPDFLPSNAPTMSTKDLVDQYAIAYNIPPSILEEIVSVESGYNPNATGDNGTSFGLLQLHFGGQGTGHTAAELENPYTNLQIGVPYVAAGYQAALQQGYTGFDLALHTAGESGHPGGSPGHYVMTSQYEAMLRQAYQTGGATAQYPATDANGNGSGATGANATIQNGTYGLFQGLDNALKMPGFEITNPVGSLLQDGSALAFRAFLFLLGLILIIFALAAVVKGVGAPSVQSSAESRAESPSEEG